MELSEQPLAVKNVEHWPVSQRMIVEMGDYAWSEHIVTIFLGLFAHGDGFTGLMKVVFFYALPTVVQGFGANETLHFRTTTFWAQLRTASCCKNVVQFGLYVA
jgi:hypothetical protein